MFMQATYRHLGDLHIFGMRTCSHGSASLPIFDLENIDLRERKTATDFFRDPLDLDLVSLLDRALICDVDVDACSCTVA